MTLQLRPFIGTSLYSSVVEHWSRKPGVMGSIPIGGIFWDQKRLSQLAGFEPTRAEPIGFQVQRLNHSATTARIVHQGKNCGDAGDRTPGLSHAKRTLYH